nr:hypothetical protein Hi04_10k_c1889_00031 [uncultured bacterium]
MNVAAHAPALLSLANCGLEGRPLPTRLPQVTPADWPHLAALATAHALGPLLYAGCRATGTRAPSEIADLLRREARASDLRAESLLRQLDAVVEAFSAAGIRTIVLKGASLARRCYPSPGLRTFTDLDILVPPGERERASKILTDLGHREVEAVPGHDRDYLAAIHYHWQFRAERGATIELHWDLTPPASPVRFDLHCLWDRARPFLYPGGQAWSLSPEDEILYLAAHISKHQFRLQLRHYFDLTAIANAGPVDWAVLAATAAASRAWDDLIVVLGVAREFALFACPGIIGEHMARTARRLDFSRLALYAAAWPFCERRHGLIDLLAAGSFRAAVRAGVAALRGTRGGSVAAAARTPAPAARRSWASRLHRAAESMRRPEARSGICAAVSIQRHFNNRQVP